MVIGKAAADLPWTESPVALMEFIAGVRRIVRAEANQRRAAGAVAGLLEAYLRRDDLLTKDQMQPDPENYQQHVLHVENDGSFSVAALVWLPGQETPIHDHVSWCVVGVYKGAEYEIRYDLCQQNGETCLVETGNGLNRQGSVDALVPPGDVHKVTNAGSGLAVSIHIYGANLAALGCSIRHRYDLPVRPTVPFPRKANGRCSASLGLMNRS